MFSQTSEYALRIVVYLASQDGKPTTTHQIAAATRAPEGYLSKVLQDLGRAGLVKSQRGLHGGFVLGRAAEELTVYDIIERVDPMPRIERCPLGIEGHGINLCPLHHRLDQAIGMVENVLRESTIAELLLEPNVSRPLCDGNCQVDKPCEGKARKSTNAKSK